MKVLISMPEDLLARIDVASRERGLSRSAFLQQAVAAALGEQDA